MIPTLPQETQDELAQLAQRYGQPLLHTADLHTSTLFDPLSARDRYGEVCMVIRRPSGRLLTITKTFYPHGAYRLPTGGINHGERIYDALLREVQEETGLTVSVSRFLVVATYRLANADAAPIFYTFAFLLDEIGGTLGALDEGERIEDYREIAPEDLPAVAARLDHEGDTYSDAIDGNWREWGEFRAVIHRLVWQVWQA
jgi:ADP-ribose pyrophosphatase YjhB (NUDIX family)